MTAERAGALWVGHITEPALPKPYCEADSTENSSLVIGRRTVLVVKDAHLSRRIANRILTEEGFRVLE